MRDRRWATKVKPRTFFVAGTDTGIGKTLIATALLKIAATQGMATIGLKPLAAGCDKRDEQWLNSDALALQQAATLHLNYPEVNPVALEPAIAPHIAAKRAGIQLAASQLIEYCRVSSQSAADVVIIEGAGGWLVPLNEKETMADVCVGLDVPVILVVGMRLGCLNHALLTAAAIRGQGLTLAAWVANCIDPAMIEVEENIAMLKVRLATRFLGAVPFLGATATADEVAGVLDAAAFFKGSS
jgi:dethiobiotin synthetase